MATHRTYTRMSDAELDRVAELCALLVLGIIWNQPGVPEVFPKTAASIFIVGLASFLTWVVTVVLEIRDRVGR